MGLASSIMIHYNCVQSQNDDVLAWSARITFEILEAIWQIYIEVGEGSPDSRKVAVVMIRWDLQWACQNQLLDPAAICGTNFL